MKRWLFLLTVIPLLSAACRGAELQTTGTPNTVTSQARVTRTAAATPTTWSTATLALPSSTPTPSPTMIPFSTPTATPSPTVIPSPNAPKRVGQFVLTGEGIASRGLLGSYQAQMFSYPILRDGLLYVTDSRNGLYVLRYTGPGAEVLGFRWVEGNVTTWP